MKLEMSINNLDLCPKQVAVESKGNITIHKP